MDPHIIITIGVLAWVFAIIALASIALYFINK